MIARAFAYNLRGLWKVVAWNFDQTSYGKALLNGRVKIKISFKSFRFMIAYLPLQLKDTKITWKSESFFFIKKVLIFNFFIICSFREVVNNNPVQKLLSVEEFKKMREEIRKDITEPKADDEIPPGEDEGMSSNFSI